MEFPLLRKKWFQFEALKIREESVSLLESLDFEILEVVDPRPLENIAKRSTLLKTCRSHSKNTNGFFAARGRSRRRAVEVGSRSRTTDRSLSAARDVDFAHPTLNEEKDLTAGC
jgi:hypothetical protein